MGKSFVVRVMLAVAMICVSGMAVGQQPAPPASNGAASKQATQSINPNNAPVTDTTVYPFGEALKVLQGEQAAEPPVPSVSAARANASGSGAATLHRKPAAGKPVVLAGPAVAAGAATGETLVASVSEAVVKLPVQPSLSAADNKALAIGQAALKADSVPEAGANGSVIYTYGAGLPTVITSPLHVSIVELEPGETITGVPAIGDSVRWELMPGQSGEGKAAQPVIILKPHESGLDTNLAITTNKRIYYLRLVSDEAKYIARVSFSYKDQEDARWRAYLEESQQKKIDSENAQVVATVAGGDDWQNLYFEYEIKGGDSSIRPIRVMDDGNKTYLTMPDLVLHMDLPALVVMNPRLKGEKAEEIVNYRVKGNLFIVDRLFDRAALVIGNGKTAEKVTIRRQKVLAVKGGK
jgi:type IV secretion system protein VirB9